MRAVRTSGVSSDGHVSSLFCRHNRFTADCPICSKDTVLRPTRPEARPARPRPSTKPKKEPASKMFRGPYVSSGPLEGGAEVRLEKVPGGLRLAVWRGGALAREAPVVPADALRRMLSEAGERGIVGWDEWGRIEAALTESAGGSGGGYVASEGRAGDLKEELRVERVTGGAVRIGRWLYWPGGGAGWELQEAPPMLPPARYAEALAAAAREGII